MESVTLVRPTTLPPLGEGCAGYESIAFVAAAMVMVSMAGAAQAALAQDDSVRVVQASDGTISGSQLLALFSATTAPLADPASTQSRTASPDDQPGTVSPDAGAGDGTNAAQGAPAAGGAARVAGCLPHEADGFAPHQTADANRLLTWSFPVGGQTGIGSLLAQCGAISLNDTIQIGLPGAGR